MNVCQVACKLENALPSHFPSPARASWQAHDPPSPPLPIPSSARLVQAHDPPADEPTAQPARGRPVVALRAVRGHVGPAAVERAALPRGRDARPDALEVRHCRLEAVRRVWQPLLPHRLPLFFARPPFPRIFVTPPLPPLSAAAARCRRSPSLLLWPTLSLPPPPTGPGLPVRRMLEPPAGAGAASGRRNDGPVCAHVGHIAAQNLGLALAAHVRRHFVGRARPPAHHAPLQLRLLPQRRHLLRVFLRRGYFKAVGAQRRPAAASRLVAQQIARQDDRAAAVVVAAHHAVAARRAMGVDVGRPHQRIAVRRSLPIHGWRWGWRARRRRTR